MTVTIPESHRDLLTDEVKAFAHLATLMADGSPQVTPVWFDTLGDFLRVNTVRGRTKDRNMTARPKVALAIQDPRDPYRYIQIRGTVVEATEDGADDHIDRLAGKYTGQATYQWGQAGQIRVIYTIRVDAVSVTG
jgi:PPOX class probable F420-dependent enzyme